MKFQFSEKWLRRMADAEPGGLMACSPEIWGAMRDEDHWLYVGSRLRDGEPCSHPGCLSHVSHPCEGCGRVGGCTEASDECLQMCGKCGKIPEGHYKDKHGDLWCVGNVNEAYDPVPIEYPGEAK